MFISEDVNSFQIVHSVANMEIHHYSLTDFRIYKMPVN